MPTPRVPLCRAALASLLAVLPLASRAQNGAPDVRYTPGVQTDIYAFAVQPSGVVAGGTKGTGVDAKGNFFDTRSLNRYLSGTGAPDPAFDVNPDGAVYALASYPDGRLLVAGDFTQVNLGGNLTSAPGLVRLKADGTLDATFTAHVARAAGAPRIVAAILQTDGSIYIGGLFDKVDGAVRGGVARLLPTGAVDPAFNPGVGVAGGSITSLAPQGAGVLVAGDFTSFSGAARPGLLRLNADGSFDPSFDAKLDAGSVVLTVLPDASTGALLVGGAQLSVAGQPAGALLRTDANGLLDAAYLAAVRATPIAGAPDPKYAQNPPATPPPGFVAALYVQDDGRVFAGGLFDGTVDGVAYHNLVRLFANGSIDPSFVLPANPNPGSQPELLAVDALALQTDGSLLVGTRVPPNYGRPVPGFPTDPVVNILINGVGLVGFRSPVYQADPDAGSVPVAVKRTFGSAAGTVVYSTADGTALAGRDYTAASGVLSWGGGDTTDRTFSLVIPPSSQGGTVLLTLSGATQGVTTYPTGVKATLTIPAPTVPAVSLSISGKGKTVEGGPKVQVVFTRTGNLSQPLDVIYKAKGDAVPGVNYKALSGHLTIPAGAAAGVVKVRPFDDAAPDPKRSVIIKLKGNPAGSYILGNPAVVAVTIKDND